MLGRIRNAVKRQGPGMCFYIIFFKSLKCPEFFYICVTTLDYEILISIR